MRTPRDSTEPLKDQFLISFAETGSTRLAASETGIGYWTPYSWNRSRPFRSQWRQARAAWTRRTKRVILGCLLDGKSLTKAAEIAEISLDTLAAWRRNDRDFDTDVAAFRLIYRISRGGR